MTMRLTTCTDKVLGSSMRMTRTELWSRASRSTVSWMRRGASPGRRKASDASAATCSSATSATARSTRTQSCRTDTSSTGGGSAPATVHRLRSTDCGRFSSATAWQPRPPSACSSPPDRTTRRTGSSARSTRADASSARDVSGGTHRFPHYTFTQAARSNAGCASGATSNSSRRISVSAATIPTAAMIAPTTNAAVNPSTSAEGNAEPPATASPVREVAIVDSAAIPSAPPICCDVLRGHGRPQDRRPRDGQIREAGLHRRVAEHLLHVERQHQEHREHRRAHDEAGHVRATHGPDLEDAESHQGLGVAQLPRDEADEQRERRSEEAERPAREPTILARLRDRVDEGGEASGHEHRAGDVERANARVTALGEQERRQHERSNAYRNVHE